LTEAKRVQQSDIQAWARFSFHRIAERCYLDAKGAVLETRKVTLRVTPVKGGFEEELVTIDGRAPSSIEKATHRRKGAFARNYSALISRKDENGRESGITLRHLLSASSYRYGGVEVLNGVKCHRLDFGPGPARRGGDMAERFLEAMTGNLWITVDGLHLFRATARTTRHVTVLSWVATIQEMEMRFESAPVAPGIWLPSKLIVKADARVVWKEVRRSDTYVYSEFQKVR
jgi:hypothetical protein